MRFHRHGKTFQLCIETAEDLDHVLELDESLWVATSAPVAAFRCDPKLLTVLDADANGRLSSDEIKAAIRWLSARLADRSQLAACVDCLPLSAINAATPEGQALLTSARYVLKTLGQESADAITLAQVREFLATVQARPLNGDGIIVPEAAEDAELAGFVNDVLATVQGGKDVSGRNGISEQHVAAFMKAVPAYLEWRRGLDIPAGESVTALMPLGPETVQLYGLYREHADKVELFFRLCRVLRFDPRSASRVAGPEANLQTLDPVKQELVEAYLQGLPLAPPNVDGKLPLDEDAVNPLYRHWIRALRTQLLPRVLESVPDAISARDWRCVSDCLAAHDAYVKGKQGGAVESLPIEKLQRYQQEPRFGQEVRELIEADKAVAGLLTGIAQVEKLLLLHQHLLRLLNNLVSFPELYRTDDRALFEMGSMVMDGRWFNMAIPVTDIAGHSAVAKNSNLFVMYLEITGTANEKFNVVVPVTSGTKGNLANGKRGVFFDTKKKEYDARVIQVIENPVSLQEALAAPFVRLWRLAEGKIESWSGSAEKQLQAEFTQTLSTAAQPAASGPPDGKASAMEARGMFMGLGLTVAAMGSAFAFITKTFSAMQFRHLLYGLSCAAVVVMLPITLIAILKLRRQDLSPLLEGCGWAVNARMRLNRDQRRFFTRVEPYPADAVGTPQRHWLRTAGIIVLALAVLFGVVHACRKARSEPKVEVGKQAVPVETAKGNVTAGQAASK